MNTSDILLDIAERIGKQQGLEVDEESFTDTYKFLEEEFDGCEEDCGDTMLGRLGLME